MARRKKESNLGGILFLVFLIAAIVFGTLYLGHAAKKDITAFCRKAKSGTSIQEVNDLYDKYNLTHMFIKNLDTGELVPHHLTEFVRYGEITASKSGVGFGGGTCKLIYRYKYVVRNQLLRK